METSVNNKCKAFTSLEQSKKLAEILPLETADMYYDSYGRFPQGYACPLIYPNSFEYNNPCWSLAALLKRLPSATLDGSDDHYYRLHCMKRYTEWYDNPVDACYEMIIKLHEFKLL